MTFVESLSATQELATLPHVAAHLLVLLEKEDVDLREITKVVESDAPLTTKILRVANSPVFAQRATVTSVQQAILALGLNRLSNIVLGVSVFTKFLLLTNKKTSKFIERFWMHSACTGMVAKSLSAKIRRSFKDFEFLGGLLHDIGKMTMIQFNPDMYEKCIARIQDDGIPDVEAEREIFGIDHCEAGGIIAAQWKLPNELQLAIREHTHPELLSTSKELVAAIRIADLLCEMWGVGVDEGIQILSIESDPAWQVLCASFPELKLLDMEVFTFELEQEMHKASEFLDILIMDTV